MQPIRRRQLIEATIDAIHAYGYDDTTVAKIAALAGLSPGIISHYFGSKGELLEATMRSLLTELRRTTVSQLAAADAPLDRIAAIVAANFHETQCTPPVVASWLAFWAQVPHAPDLARLQRIYRSRLRSNLRRELRRLGLDREAAADVAELLASLIDGIWVRAALAGGGLDTVRARRRVMDTLRLHLAAAGADL
nr:transcriptional regulator BetI [Azospirillum halopraeferens]